MGTYISPKFGGKWEIALSSGDERYPKYHHRAHRRHSSVAGTDAADASPDVHRPPLSYPWHLAGSEPGVGEHHLAQCHFIAGRPPPGTRRTVGQQPIVDAAPGDGTSRRASRFH